MLVKIGSTCSDQCTNKDTLPMHVVTKKVEIIGG